jgi:Ankyrin repeats (3 copies)
MSMSSARTALVVALAVAGSGHLIALGGPLPVATVDHRHGQQEDADGITPLMRAAARGQVGELNGLLAKGADVNARTTEQRVTALMFAAYFGHADAVKALLAKGAQLNLKDAQGAAAVDWASLGDHPELEKPLTGPGAVLNPFLNTGQMPIWLMDKAAGK